MVNISAASKSQVKLELLRALEANTGGFVSGEKLGQQLGISRTSVWKHIQALRHQGYAIESLPRQGHRLLSCPDSLLSLEIQKQLHTRLLGQTIYCFPQLTSTQNIAFQLAQKGAPEGTLIVAEEQTGARGRLGRFYFSPRGGVWFSLVLKPPLQPQLTLPISLMAGVAVAEALKGLSGLPLVLKWPNDIFVRDKKVVGILTEMVAESDRVQFVICGIGVNANIEPGAFPEELRPIATSLKIELGYEISRTTLLCQVVESLDRYYHLFLLQGPQAIIEAWRRSPNMLGKKVRVSSPEETMKGMALDLDSQGALQVQTDTGLVKQVVAGDVRLLEN